MASLYKFFTSPHHADTYDVRGDVYMTSEVTCYDVRGDVYMTSEVTCI